MSLLLLQQASNDANRVSDVHLSVLTHVKWIPLIFQSKKSEKYIQMQGNSTIVKGK